jgi:hypothetical protein
MAAWFLLQLCVMLTPMATCPWENLATATGSVRVDTLGCSVALPCWCLTADRWGVSFRPLRTVKFQRHRRHSQTSLSKKGNRTCRTQPKDPTCPLELCPFQSEAGPETNIDFSELKCVAFPAVFSGSSWSVWRLSPKRVREVNMATNDA